MKSIVILVFSIAYLTSFSQKQYGMLYDEVETYEDLEGQLFDIELGFDYFSEKGELENDSLLGIEKLIEPDSIPVIAFTGLYNNTVTTMYVYDTYMIESFMSDLNRIIKLSGLYESGYSFHRWESTPNVPSQYGSTEDRYTIKLSGKNKIWIYGNYSSGYHDFSIKINSEQGLKLLNQMKKWYSSIKRD